MNRDFDGGLVSPSDIAVLANVTRAAVSNWRRRRSDFPTPAGGTVANPLFSRSLVEDWLRLNGRPVEQGSPDMSAWSVMNRYRGQLPIDLKVATLHAVLCARKLFDARPERADLSRAARDGHLLEELSRLADSAGPGQKAQGDLLRVPAGPGVDRKLQESCAGELWQVADGLALTDIAKVSHRIIARASSSEGRVAGEFSPVDSPVSTLLACCAATHDGTVYDPVCGIGETLIRIATAADSAATNLVGRDADPGTVLLAQQRCFLADVDADISEAQLFALDPDPNLRADAVVAQLPLAGPESCDFPVADPRWILAGPPPPRNPEVGWLQHVISHLAPEGRGYVVASPATTFAMKTAKFRRQLIHAGCIEAIVGLPPKVIPSSAVPPVLWVVCRPGASRFGDSVLVVDASALSPLDDLPVAAWLKDSSTLDTTDGSWTNVPVTDLLADEEVSLSPRGLTESKVDGGEIADRYVRAQRDFAAASRAMGLANLETRVRNISTSHVATIRQLERQGVITISRARGRPQVEVEPDDPRIVTTRHVREGLPVLPSQPGPPEVGKNLTESGDVLVTTLRTLYAVVDQTGGRSVQPGVFRLRIDQGQLDPLYVAACVTAGWNQRFETNFYVPHANIRDLEIPIIPLSDQRNVVESLDRTRSVADAATLAASAVGELAEVLLESVRFNVEIPLNPS